MIETVIEVVERFAARVSRIQRQGLVVGSVEVGMEASEEFGERDVGFAVSEIAAGVEYEGFAVDVEGGVAGPEVAVEERGKWLVVVEKAR